MSDSGIGWIVDSYHRGLEVARDAMRFDDAECRQIAAFAVLAEMAQRFGFVRSAEKGSGDGDCGTSDGKRTSDVKRANDGERHSNGKTNGEQIAESRDAGTVRPCRDATEPSYTKDEMMVTWDVLESLGVDMFRLSHIKGWRLNLRDEIQLGILYGHELKFCNTGRFFNDPILKCIKILLAKIGMEFPEIPLFKRHTDFLKTGD